MSKVKIGPSSTIFPMPCALASCGTTTSKQNFSTIAYAGVVNGTPPMVSISVRPSRYTYAQIKEHGFFGVNIPSVDIIEETNVAGCTSGRNIDKFEKTNLTPFFGEKTGVVLISECPISLECRLVKTIELPMHTVFIGEVLETYINSDLVKDGKFTGCEDSIICYGAGKYWSVGKFLKNYH